jgi:ABC-type nitrate/sulfonate/bicarbonate transport system substrate-binding protein
MLRQRAFTVLSVSTLAIVALAACGDDSAESGSDTSAPGTTADAPDSGVSPVVAGEPFPADRCGANEAAGQVGFVTSFDFAAAASIVEVLVADAAGYYEELCLDVTIEPSFSTANYPLVAANDKQFSSAGSFSEVVNFAAANEADFVVMSVDGRVPIDSLMVKQGEATELADLAGSTIGVKGKLPPSITAMLKSAGLTEGTDFQTVLVDGFDPVAHMALPDIVGVPGWKSNEPGQLERAGVPFTLFDPTEAGIPGSFGIIYTNAAFVAEHPSAAEDFMRATMRGLADAIADPQAAADVAVALIDGNGNPNFLSPEGEVFRWQTEAELITATTPDGVGVGVPDAAGLQAEVDASAAVGLFGDTTPSIEERFDPDLVASLYTADGSVIWPVK